MPPLPRARAWGVLAAMVLAIGFALHARIARGPLLVEISRALRREPVAGVRLSVATGFRVCPAGAIPPSCGQRRRASRRLIRLLGRGGRAAEHSSDPDSLRAVALMEMVYGDSSGNSLHRSISLLQSAARLSNRPAPVLTDLSAAHLMQAVHTRNPIDLVEGLQAATQALDLEPEYAPARFNSAEAMDRLGLRREAAREWARYLQADSTSPWAAEARRRRMVARPARAVREPGRTAPPGALAEYAAAAPGEARALGWNRLLGEWAAAVLAGDTATAQRRLDQAEEIGTALRMRGGDESLADVVTELRQNAGDPPVIRRFAAAHRGFAAGYEAYARTDYRAGCPTIERAGMAGNPALLREWARTFTALCLHYLQRTKDAERVLAEIAPRVDETRFPALAGRRWWALGGAYLSMSRYEDALAPLMRAEPLMRRAGEDEWAAGALSHLGQARLRLGDGEGGYTAFHQAAVLMADDPASLQLYNVIFALGNGAAEDGMMEAAMRIRDEQVAVAEEMGRPQYIAEARLARARLRLAAGRTDVGADVRRAARLIATVKEDFAHRWLSEDLRETSAAARVATQPARAAAELDSVADYFAFRNFPDRLVPALLGAAEAKLVLRRSTEAATDLARATEVLDTLRTHVEHASLRASLLEGSRRVFDRAVRLSLDEGRPYQALDYIERSRSSFSPIGHAADWARRPLRAPDGQVALELALIGDTLLAWTFGPGGSKFTRIGVRRDQLVQDVQRIRTALERGSGSAALPALERLHARLLGPLQGQLGESGTPLVIVADGELSAIPFAALRDRERGRYLMEDHPLRFASSLRDPVSAHVPPRRGAPATVIANPTFDRVALSGLEPLTGATVEAAGVARHYPGARVVAGAAARVDTLLAAFTRGGIVHFAGHALFDDARPERSFLVAAGPGRSGRLTAAEIERMDLHRLQLVVLSACQTSRARAGRSGGFAGLAGAFLAAGAGGVVGSLWQVDDQATRPLMEAFHQEFARSGDAADALRRAQVRMLRLDDPALRDPSAWAGFRYAGP